MLSIVQNLKEDLAIFEKALKLETTILTSRTSTQYTVQKSVEHYFHWHSISQMWHQMSNFITILKNYHLTNKDEIRPMYYTVFILLKFVYMPNFKNRTSEKK